MFIHLGNNITVSDRECIGIFNTETLKLGSDNEFFLKDTGPEDKVISVNEKNEIKSSWVSPFTVIKRDAVSEDEIIWSREND